MHCKARADQLYGNTHSSWVQRRLQSHHYRSLEDRWMVDLEWNPREITNPVIDEAYLALHARRLISAVNYVCKIHFNCTFESNTLDYSNESQL